jgi:pSer/pThr/pTyr-binding forkhead associated (FHA) protein
MRHAFLQVVGGRVFATDLGSRVGLWWPEGRKTYGWLRPGEPVWVGPFRVTLVNPVSERPAAFGPRFQPLAAGPDVPAGLPRVTVGLHSGRSAGTQWRLKRVLTLVGRAKDCKVQLLSPGVSQFHAVFVLTVEGLWVVDLLGRGGVIVNGRAERFARLADGDELVVGRLELGISCPTPKVASVRER